MNISIIAAKSENNVIGHNNALPWHVPEELQYFRKKTLGKPVIMGRKTFQSLGCKPLPNRRNIVLTGDSKAFYEGCTIVNSVESILKIAHKESEIMIIGGTQIFQIFLPLASRMYLSTIHQICEGDSFFPPINWSQWKLIESHPQEQFTAQIFDRC